MVERQRIDDKVWNYKLLSQQHWIKINRLNSTAEMAMDNDFSGSDQIRSEAGNLITASKTLIVCG